MSNEAFSPLTRLAGPAAILAGALFTVAQLAVLTLDRNDRVAASMTLIFKIGMAGYVTGFFVLMIALFALYQRQAVRAGTLGVVALCVAIAGTMDMAGNQWFDGFVVPWLAEVAPDSFRAPKTNTIIIAALSSYLLYALGWVLFGIARFPRPRLPAGSVHSAHDRRNIRLRRRFSSLRDPARPRSSRPRRLVSDAPSTARSRPLSVLLRRCTRRTRDAHDGLLPGRRRQEPRFCL